MLHHVGVYAYRPESLRRWAGAEPVESEITHSLEQLRPLAYGERIGVSVLEGPVPRGIDTAADLQWARDSAPILI